jgi:hypothetical protein
VSTAEQIAGFIEETRELRTEEDFVASYPYPFLVQEATQTTAPRAGRSERTTIRLREAAVPTGDGFAQGDVWIQHVCPKDPSRNEGAVLLGRDGDCDIVVVDASISSVHSRFTLEWGEGEEKIFYVTDADSSNGTFLNGEKIAPETAVRLSDQDSLRFGPAVKFQFFTAEGFFQFLDLYRRIKKGLL